MEADTGTASAAAESAFTGKNELIGREDTVLSSLGHHGYGILIMIFAGTLPLFPTLTRSLAVKFKHLHKRHQSRTRLSVQQLERRNLLAGELGHNFVEAGDVNLDGNVSPLDAVVVINELSVVSDSPVEFVSGNVGETKRLLDVDANGEISVNDVLQVVNHLGLEGYVTRVEEEDLAKLATAILMEDLPPGMHVHTAQQWFSKLHEKMDKPLPRRAAFEHFDSNGDGQLTKDEVSHFHWRRISELDTDATGGVSRDEVKAARPSEHMLALLPDNAKPHFESLDADQDGQLSAYEVAQNLWERIDVADVNEDGLVSLDELREIREHRKLQYKQHEAFFKRFDGNDDGLLTAHELPARLWEKFSAADVDEDGAISGTELAEVQGRKESGSGPLDPSLFDLEAKQRFSGNYSGMTKPEELVIDTDQIWMDVWKKVHLGHLPKPILPSVDFQKEAVLGVFMGWQNTGGHMIQIIGVRDTGAWHEVLVRKTSPGREDFTAAVMTAPYELLVVNKSSKPFKFVFEDAHS